MLQLGVKEWTLCTTKEEAEAADLAQKLNTCSTYHPETFNRERAMLYLGDVLFMSRLVVHSARALPETYRPT